MGAADSLAALEQGFFQQSASLGLLNEQVEGHPVVAEVQTWRKLCRRFRLDDSVAVADGLTEGFFQQTAVSWEAAVSDFLGTPEAVGCFRRLLQTTHLQLAAQNQAAVGSAGLPPLTAAREALRRALQQCLDNDAPATELRERWAAELIDHCDMLLTAIDHVPPDRAAGDILLVIDDLQWHVDHVETQSGTLRRRLRRRLSRLRAEGQERDLQHRLEACFGHRMVAGMERLILVLICLVVGLMMAEMLGDWSARTILWFNVIDAAACTVFLAELGTKLCFVRGRLSWFRRHFLIDFVPSIPVGVLSHGLTTVGNIDSLRAIRLTRFLRLSRLTRYVRLLRPLIRMLRGLGLLARGLDRLARRYGHILNRTIILHPTREELNRNGQALPGQQTMARRLRAELREQWRQLLAGAPAAQQPQVAGVRLSVLEMALEQSLQIQVASSHSELTAAEEIPIGQLIERLRTATPEDVNVTLGEELVGHLARAIRIVVCPPFRWIPPIGYCMPQLSDEMTESETVTAASHRMATVLKRYLSAWYWVADLYGTVTPSQFVDRVGTMLVNSSFRPAYRLLMFGGLYVLLILVLEFVSLEPLRPVLTFLEQYVGTAVMVVGAVCVLILTVGWWLKRLAREATEFYERSALAQFLSLTEMIRSRHLQRDTSILYDRVLRPEWLVGDGETGNTALPRPGQDGDAAMQPLDADSWETQLAHFRDRVCESLVNTYAGAGDDFPGLESTVLLYRDWLDGAMFTDNDTRTTSQLLGNPAVRQFLSLSGRVSRRQVKSLQLLDLVHQKSLLGGPYLWFNFISRSITHAVASLLVDYNQQAVPLAEQPRLSEALKDRHRRWLATEETAFQESPGRKAEGELAERNYVTNAFTALHFLDITPQRDRDVETRFGHQVLEKLRNDRGLMIRRIFGSFPMHARPKEQRVVNLYGLYNSWLAGGRAFLVPWYLFVAGLKSLKHLLLWIAASVQEIRRPELRTRRRDAAKAHFRSAVRKIERIRGPVVLASLRLRVTLDPEYLGVPMPGNERSSLEGADVDADLRFLQPDPEIVEDVERARRRAAADMNRLNALIADGLLDRVAEQLGLPAAELRTPPHLRATAVVYLADLREVRRHLSAEDILQEVFHSAATQPVPLRGQRPHPLLQRVFNRYWKRHGFGGRRDRRAAWHAVTDNVQGVADALRIWHRQGQQARSEGERLLGELLLHPSRVTEQLVALRTIQTLAVLDVLSYREHIYELGQYADMGDNPGELLHWRTTIGQIV